MSISDAAHDIDLSPFKGWLDPERIIVNVNTLYRDFGAENGLSPLELRAWMGRYRHAMHEHDHSDGHAHKH